MIEVKPNTSRKSSEAKECHTSALQWCVCVQRVKRYSCNLVISRRHLTLTSALLQWQARASKKGAIGHKADSDIPITSVNSSKQVDYLAVTETMVTVTISCIKNPIKMWLVALHLVLSARPNQGVDIAITVINPSLTLFPIMIYIRLPPAAQLQNIIQRSCNLPSSCQWSQCLQVKLNISRAVPNYCPDAKWYSLCQEPLFWLTEQKMEINILWLWARPSSCLSRLSTPCFPLANQTLPSSKTLYTTRLKR